jgi:hypothetical protein
MEFGEDIKAPRGGKLATLLCEVNGSSLRLYLFALINLYMRSVFLFIFTNRILHLAPGGLTRKSQR